tara:strand:+ start:61 stop:240 length:180 start_codon:yes stop_codon:yes gene_type:complete
MSRLKDLLIDFEQDVPTALKKAVDFDSFKKNMCKINPLYELNMWKDELKDAYFKGSPSR